MNFDEWYTRLLKSGYERLLRPMLFRFGYGDPEVAHEQTLRILAGIPDVAYRLINYLIGAKTNPVNVSGIQFPGRVGVAAGVDKDGLAVPYWSDLGMGFAELGTVTPRPQTGNPKPRLFRLRESRAVINRMGFNNGGVQAMKTRLQEAGLGTSGHGKLETRIDIPIGVSIGKNRQTVLEKAVDDYVFCAEQLRDVADYLAINVSSPNTPGLRRLQADAELATITSAVVEAASGTPVFVKISPDMDDTELDHVLATCEDSGASAIIATNTTINRYGLAREDQYVASQIGGMSGAPLTARALQVVEQVASRTTLPVVGVGGIMSPADAQRMFDAGAVLVQIYTGFIFHGPALAVGINRLTNPRAD